MTYLRFDDETKLWHIIREKEDGTTLRSVEGNEDVEVMQRLASSSEGAELEFHTWTFKPKKGTK